MEPYADNADLLEHSEFVIVSEAKDPASKRLLPSVPTRKVVTVSTVRQVLGTLGISSTHSLILQTPPNGKTNRQLFLSRPFG